MRFPQGPTGVFCFFARTMCPHWWAVHFPLEIKFSAFCLQWGERVVVMLNTHSLSRQHKLSFWELHYRDQLLCGVIDGRFHLRRDSGYFTTGMTMTWHSFVNGLNMDASSFFWGGLGALLTACLLVCWSISRQNVLVDWVIPWNWSWFYDSRGGEKLTNHYVPFIWTMIF